MFSNLNLFALFSFREIIQINLRLIMVSGKTKEFLFSPSESAGDIAQTVFEQWPEGKHIFEETINFCFQLKIVQSIASIAL